MGMSQPRTVSTAAPPRWGLPIKDVFARGANQLHGFSDQMSRDRKLLERRAQVTRNCVKVRIAQPLRN